MTAMIEQTFRLGQDVVNPEPDRRARYDWTKLPVWPKGMRFRVIIEEGRMRKIESLSGLYHGIWSHDNRYNSIMAAAVYDSADPVAAMGYKAAEAGITQEMIIREILACGNLSIPYMERVVDRLIREKAEKEAGNASGE